MKTLLYPAFDQLELAEQPQPTAGPGEVLLRVAACGICGSELEAVKHHSPRRPPPLVMGHEFCGVIAELGPGVSGFQVGQKVVSNSLASCGHCVRCRRGDSHLCADRQIFGMKRQGAFAEYVNVPTECLIPWPNTLPAQAACLAEPLGNGLHMVHLTEHLKPQTVLVMGAGPIGLMAQLAFQSVAGATVFVTDLKAERLSVADKLGSKLTVNGTQTDVVQTMLEQTEGEGVDLVIDAVGAAVTKKQSLAATRPGGSVVWIGLTENNMNFNSYDITLPEKQVFGTYAATIKDLREAVTLMDSEKIDVTSWVQTFPIERSVEAFQRMLAAEGHDIKAVLLPSGEPV
ncbi:MAG: alcohol dehydrogenase catalytic domain-containing protein [Abitibacteriaceae bacterium]|nr:alcohol dehydrogenase catalytic domain-containing protein [Abditibacteriaceae bacterium]